MVTISDFANVKRFNVNVEGRQEVAVNGRSPLVQCSGLQRPNPICNDMTWSRTVSYSCFIDIDRSLILRTSLSYVKCLHFGIVLLLFFHPVARRPREQAIQQYYNKVMITKRHK